MHDDGREREEIRGVGDRRELDPAERLDRRHPLELGEVEFDRLDEPREVGDDQEPLVLVLAEEDQDLAIPRVEELERPSAEDLVPLAERDQPLHPLEQRRGSRSWASTLIA